MSERILEIANPARLNVKDAQLVIEREECYPSSRWSAAPALYCWLIRRQLFPS